MIVFRRVYWANAFITQRKRPRPKTLPNRKQIDVLHVNVLLKKLYKRLRSKLLPLRHVDVNVVSSNKRSRVGLPSSRKRCVRTDLQRNRIQDRRILRFRALMRLIDRMRACVWKWARIPWTFLRMRHTISDVIGEASKSNECVGSRSCSVATLLAVFCVCCSIRSVFADGNNGSFKKTSKLKKPPRPPIRKRKRSTQIF